MPNGPKTFFETLIAHLRVTTPRAAGAGSGWRGVPLRCEKHVRGMPNGPKTFFETLIAHLRVTTPRAAGASSGWRGVPLRCEKHARAVPIGRSGYGTGSEPAALPPAAVRARRADRSFVCVLPGGVKARAGACSQVLAARSKTVVVTPHQGCICMKVQGAAKLQG